VGNLQARSSYGGVFRNDISWTNARYENYKTLTSGPFIAGFLSMTDPEGWRWLFWLLTIFGGISTLILFFTLPETYAPMLLKKKARAVSARTGDSLVYAEIEREDRRILKILKITLSRPFQLLFGDIIIFLVCLYLSFCYGVQYLFFQVISSLSLLSDLGISYYLPRDPRIEPWRRRSSFRSNCHRVFDWLCRISVLRLSSTTRKSNISRRSIISKTPANI
jgi:hypothetical protein